MARNDAAPLISLADKISREGPCAQARDIRALSARRVALVNAHRVPRALAESLSTGVNVLVEEIPPCLPAVPPTAAQPTVTVPEHGHGHGHEHGKHKDHGGEGGD